MYVYTSTLKVVALFLPHLFGCYPETGALGSPEEFDSLVEMGRSKHRAARIRSITVRRQFIFSVTEVCGERICPRCLLDPPRLMKISNRTQGLLTKRGNGTQKSKHLIIRRAPVQIPFNTRLPLFLLAIQGFLLNGRVIQLAMIKMHHIRPSARAVCLSRSTDSWKGSGLHEIALED